MAGVRSITDPEMHDTVTSSFASSKENLPGGKWLFGIQGLNRLRKKSSR